MFVVVAYDIADDRRRLRVMQMLQGYGEHVQESVFECDLGRPLYLSMRKRLNKLLNLRQDNLRLYHLCRADIARIEELGVGRPVQVAQEFKILSG